MQIDMQDFKNMVVKLTLDPASASMKVDDHPKMDRLHVYQFGYDIEDMGLVNDVESIFDISIKAFGELIDQLPA